ncbi:glycosyltransferase family 10 domain-containing protein [Psychromonas algicola]|uniref:glycosyltransferase family 10 domain-containing protein n=1 Tax=Psychromonas algicola TaxID=2555642 RepID=UPI00106849D6|nr:glycosyltransferase family 10 [Psychromonas sp. RZ5]TEW50704.1 hypothetical protein E2R67_08865 [Psychromonas sp. RZ5]
MKKACLVVSSYLTENKIFNVVLHRDNWVDRFIKLKAGFALKGYDLSTQDINSIDDSEIVIYASNMPSELPRKNSRLKSYLILSESAFIRPDNYDLQKLKHFNKVFTWYDELVDGKQYIKLNYAHAFPKQINKDIYKKDKLCVLIAGNKKPKPTLDSHLKGLDLYSEREKAIRWFEEHHPDDFDLYGVGWNRYQFTGPKIIRGFNRLPIFPELFQKLLRLTYPSYKGMVDHKRPVMERYRFSICYENAKDIPGYITEKIFDSFFAGCVPVYWGADNVKDNIPEGCFIDKRSFSTYEAIYDYMNNMTDNDYLVYLNNISTYLNSEKALPFKSEGFVSTIIKAIFTDDSKVRL